MSSQTPPNTTGAQDQAYLTSEFADLGLARAEHDTAAVGKHDYALISAAPVMVQAGRAPQGLEGQVFAWNTFQYTTEERDDREDLKGELHEGQLHRQNRAAAEAKEQTGSMGIAMGMNTGGGGDVGGRARGGRGQGMGEKGGGKVDALCAGRKPEQDAPPMAKGMAEEMDKSMFWDEPIL